MKRGEILLLMLKFECAGVVPRVVLVVGVGVGVRVADGINEFPSV